jgi:hypothetical protein
LRTEVAVDGIVDHYVVKNGDGQYLDGELTWTTDYQKAWKYNSPVAWDDAQQYMVVGCML